MSRKDLSDWIADQLQVDRGDEDKAYRFRHIVVMLVSRLERVEHMKRKDVLNKLGLDLRKIRGLLRFDPKQKARFWKDLKGNNAPKTKTWALCAASLLIWDWEDPDEEGLGTTKAADRPRGVGGAYLEQISAIARSRPVTAARRKRQLERFGGKSTKRAQDTALDPENLSSEEFSQGIAERLQDLYGRVQCLTIEQLRVLEASLRHPRLWVEGSAGSGKTIVAMEIAYRTMASGASCAIAYRSGQFRSLFKRVLGDVPGGKLFLVPHDELLSAHIGSVMERESMRQSLWKKVGLLDCEALGLLIVDDFATIATRLGEGMAFLGELRDVASRILVLAAPDQALDSFMVSRTTYRESGGFWGARDDYCFWLDPFKLSMDGGIGGMSSSSSGLITLSNDVTCPPEFARVELPKNVRNAARIVRHGRLCSPLNSAVRESGVVTKVECGWEGLERSIERSLNELLEDYAYAPSQIRILVDPYLLPLCGWQAPDERVRQLAPLAWVVARLGSPSSRKWLSEEGAKVLQEAVSGISQDGLHVAWADDVDAGVVCVAGVDDAKSQQRTVSRTFGRYQVGVHAEEAFTPDFPADPLNSKRVILAYPTPLFIGLESDAVVYVRSSRSSDDASDWYGIEKVDAEVLRQLRARHHAFAISRARFHLVDIAVS